MIQTRPAPRTSRPHRRTSPLLAALVATVLPAVVVAVGAPRAAEAAPVSPLPVLDTWAWCGVHPDDPVALPSARAMATVGGVDVTFGPCNVPTPDYTPANTANRYVSPITYSRLVTLNASVGMKTVVYDARLWSETPSVRQAAIDFWRPQVADIAAWDMGDEFDPIGPEWPVLVRRWNLVRAGATAQTGVPPFANHFATTTATAAALRDLPGSDQLLSFAQYTGDLGAGLARSLDRSVRTLMCGVNAFTHLQFRPSAASIRADMSTLRAAGCDRILVFGGQRVYGTDLFGDASLAERDGSATDWAAAVQEGAGRSSYVAMAPVRVLETRRGAGLVTVDGRYEGVGVRGAGSVTQLTVAGRAGVPSTATAVALTVTATNTAAPGFVTVYPCDAERPNASQLNYGTGSTVSATIIATVASSGWVCLFTQSDVDLVVDLAGYYPAGSTYVGSTPARLFESRVGEGLATVDGRDLGGGRRAAGSITTLQVSGRGGVPVSAGDAVLQVTVVDPLTPGFVTVFPCAEPTVPTASTVNFRPGVVSTNAVVAALDPAGTVCLFTSAEIDLVVDVGGHHPRGSTTVPITPVRLLDTRPAPAGGSSTSSTADGQFAGVGLRPIDSVTVVQVAGRAGIPADVGSVVLNLTVTEPAGPGFVVVYPCSSGRPNAASINVGAGETIANLVVADLDASGRVCLYTMTPTHLVVDVTAVHR